MAARADARAISCDARARHRARLYWALLGREAARQVYLRVLWRRALSFADEIRFRHGLAEFLCPRRARCDRGARGPLLADAPGRGALRQLQRAFGPRLSRWSGAHGSSLLHERHRAEVHARRQMTAHLDLDAAAPRADAAAGPTPRLPAPPVALCRPQRRIVHGVELVDEYAWLRANNWQEVLRDPSALPPEIATYLRAENAYTDAVLAPTRDLQARLLRELRGRIKEDDRQVPWPDGLFDYYSRYRVGGQHQIICRRPRDSEASEAEEILLDGDALGQGKPFFEIGCAEHSPDHALLAWSVDARGSEYFSIHVRDLSSGRDLPDEIVNTSGRVVWSADSRAFY